MRPSYSHPVILLLPLSLMLIPSGQASACGDEEKVEVRVVSILATDKDNTIDPKLKDLAARIRKEKPKLNFTGFKVAKQDMASPLVDQAHTFKLIDKQEATVTVLQAANKNNQVRLTVKLKCGSEMTYTTCCGKYLPICTCYKTAGGECLLIAVMVKPCKDK